MSDVMTQMMRIKIEAFGAIQRLLPERLSFEVDKGAMVSEVLNQITQNHPDASRLLDRCACAVGENIISRQSLLEQECTLVLLSPVAGG